MKGVSNIDKDPNKNPDEKIFDFIKANMKPESIITITEYLLYPSELRKHFIKINIGYTKSNWIFDLFSPEEKKAHIDAFIDKNSTETYISPYMTKFMSKEQKYQKIQKAIESGGDMPHEDIKLLEPEQLKQFITNKIKTPFSIRIDGDLFELLDSETKLLVIYYLGYHNLENSMKSWFDNYTKGLKREEQIKSIL